MYYRFSFDLLLVQVTKMHKAAGKFAQFSNHSASIQIKLFIFLNQYKNVFVSVCTVYVKSLFSQIQKREEEQDSSFQLFNVL